VYADVSKRFLAADIPETESQGRGGSLDFHRTGAAVAHQKNSIYSAEATSVPASGQAWRQAFMNYWTQNNQGVASEVQGFMSWTNRLFATGVNRLVFHGASYKITDFTNYSATLGGPGVLGSIYGNPSGTWPGYGYMQGMNYPNEWDDKQPNWEHFNVMTNYLSRTQMALQQGVPNVDLAYYRLSNVVGNTNAGEMREVEKYGYTLDLVSPALLKLQNTGVKDGQVVLQPSGQAYKALVLDQRRSGTTREPYPMTLETADRILSYAEAGLPIVVVGDLPFRVGSYPGVDSAIGGTVDFSADESALVAKMAQLLAYPNVAQIDNATDVANQTGVAAALAGLGVYPDAKAGMPESNTNMVVRRDGGDVEFYFFANDSQTSPCSQTVTLKGEGSPYLLDAWSGNITPIAQYIAADGAVTLDVNLAANGQMIVAIAPDGWSSKPAVNPSATYSTADSLVYTESGNLAMRTAASGNYAISLSTGDTVAVTAPDDAEAPINLNDGNYNWEFVLHKWMPLTTTTDMTDGNFLKTRIEDSATYNITSLVPWIAIDPANLAAVAGNGEYTTRFNLEKGWAEGQGAILQFTRVSDVMRVWVNNQEANPDQIANRADIGPYLLAGENELVVKVTSTMGNVRSAAMTQFGVVGDVIITPYIQTDLYHTLTVNNGSGGGSYLIGSTAAAMAGAAPAGQRFSRWAATGMELTAQQASQNPLTFEMPYSDVSLTALYSTVSLSANAFVQKQNGNKNNLTITVTEIISEVGSDESSEATYTATISINNNAAGVYEAGPYKVYVDTKGNTQIREIYIVN
ncbi:MAG: hypothetical protein FWH55_11550, partial [Oscillospiraceae bacterium]|nr:hypothetical protein [Oscillospiraceae bacterium]